MDRMQLQTERFGADETRKPIESPAVCIGENQCNQRCEVRRLLRVRLSVISRRTRFLRTRNLATVRRYRIPGLRHPGRLLPTWTMILLNSGRPEFRGRIPQMTNQSGCAAGCDKASPVACLMLHLRSRYVSKAAILTVPVLLVLVENRSPA